MYAFSVIRLAVKKYIRYPMSLIQIDLTFRQTL